MPSKPDWEKGLEVDRRVFGDNYVRSWTPSQRKYIQRLAEERIHDVPQKVIDGPLNWKHASRLIEHLKKCDHTDGRRGDPDLASHEEKMYLLYLGSVYHIEGEFPKVVTKALYDHVLYVLFGD